MSRPRGSQGFHWTGVYSWKMYNFSSTACLPCDQITRTSNENHKVLCRKKYLVYDMSVKREFHLTYHDIVLKDIHEVTDFVSLVIRKPDSTLKLVTSVQQNHVVMVTTYVTDGCLTPGDATIATVFGGIFRATLSPVQAELCHVSVYVIRVQYAHVEVARNQSAMQI